MVRIWDILTLINFVHSKPADLQTEFDDLFSISKGCLPPNKTYIINIHAHVQNEVKNAIVSIITKLGSGISDEVQAATGERASLMAIRSYFGTIFDAINADLFPFKVQFNLILEKNEMDQISANGAFDSSCELTSPVAERTQNAFSSLTSKLNNVIGIHLYLFGCIHMKKEFDLINVISNNICGRVIGVMWVGSDDSMVLIKSAILEGITGAKDAYANGYLTIANKGSLCAYCEKCIGITPTIHGQQVNHSKRIKHTRDESSEVHHIQ